MYLSERRIMTGTNGDHPKKYEIKPFDESYPVPVKSGNMTFAALREGGLKNAVFCPMDKSGGFSGNEDFGGMKSGAERNAGIEREAYEKGFAQGEKDGIELGAAKASKLTAHIESLLDEMLLLRKDLVKRYEKDILDMICAIAQKVVCREVALDNTPVKEAVIRAIEIATDKRSVQLRVNPEDFNYMEGLKPGLFCRFGELGSLVVAADPSVKRGGCFLETPYGDVDARVETQLELIRRTLENAYAGSPDE